MRSLIAVATILLCANSSAGADTVRRRAVSPATSMERVLVPLVREGLIEPPHYLYAELFLNNDGPGDISIAYEEPCVTGTPPVGLDPCLTHPRILPVDRLTEVIAADGSRGIFLYVDRGKFDQISHTLRVQDSPSGFPPPVVLGTELPLIRERQFSSTLHLLNVPAGGEPVLHKFLRIYGTTTAAMTVLVSLNAVDHSAEKPLETLTVTLQGGQTNGAFDVTPAFAEVDLADAIARNRSQIPQGRITLGLQSAGGELFWAFVAVVDEDAHEWTTVTPDR